jgi:hypothetical protein
MPAPSLFPANTVEDAAAIALTIAHKNAGQAMQRLDIFHELGRAPDSGTSRTLVTSSSGYGLTLGGYKAEQLSLTDRGRQFAVEGDKAALLEAVLAVPLFKKFFEQYANAQFPADVPAKSFLAMNLVPKDRLDACLQVIRRSGEQVGLVQERSGAARILSHTAAVATSQSAAARLTTEASAVESPPIPGALPSQLAQAVALPSFNINLEIHLPPSATPETYEAIFRGIREQLLDHRVRD